MDKKTQKDNWFSFGKEFAELVNANAQADFFKGFLEGAKTTAIEKKLSEISVFLSEKEKYDLGRLLYETDITDYYGTYKGLRRK